MCHCEETAKQEEREEKKKDEVEGREGEESTPKPVAAGSYREVPLLFKLPSLSSGRWTDK